MMNQCRSIRIYLLASEELISIGSLFPYDLGSCDEPLVIYRQQTPFPRVDIFGFVE
jgi:hypothetical protein